MRRVENANIYVHALKVNKHGDSICVLLRRAIRDLLSWQHGDIIMARVAGDKLILERVNTAKFGIVRTGQAVQREE